MLVLHQHYWPEIAATAQLLTDVCEDMATAGWEVTVVCGQPSYRKVEGVDAQLPREQAHRGVQIRRVWSYVPGRRDIPRRLAHYASFFGSSLLEAARVARPDVVLIMSTPPLLLGVSGSLLHALRGVPFVYSVQDVYPDVAVSLGVLPERGPLTSAIGAAARVLYRQAQRVVTLSEGMADSLVAHGVARDQITVIPNWADCEQVRPLPRDNAFARAHGLTDRFVVQYSGNVGLSQGLEHLLQAAAQIPDDDVLFTIVGDGNAREGLRRQARELGLRNVTFLDPQPRERLPELLASADVSLVPMRRGVANDLVPSKLYGIMAAGRPVLASVDARSEVARVLREFECGVVAQPDDAASLAQAIKKCRDMSPSVLEGMGQRGREACEARFSRRVCTGAYRAALLAAAGGSAAAEAGLQTEGHGRPLAEGTR